MSGQSLCQHLIKDLQVEQTVSKIYDWSWVGSSLHIWIILPIFVPTPNKRFTSWTNSFQNLWLVMSWKQFTHLNYPTDKASRHCKLKVILLSKQRHNARENGTALQFPLTVLWNNTWPHFYFLAHLQIHRKSKTSHSCCKCLLHQLSWIASNHFDLGLLKKEQKTSKGCLITHVLDWWKFVKVYWSVDQLTITDANFLW